MSLETEFIPYEQALALKELGFDEPCFGFYDESLYFPNNENQYGTFCNQLLDAPSCSAPLYQQAFRFLLDQLEFVSITYFNDGSGNLKRIGEGIFFDFNNREDCLIELINQVKIKKQ